MKVLREEREMSVQFVKSSVSAFGLAPSDENRALRLVELCGRTAYKSEDKITEDSAKKFVLMLKSHGHLSVLEHSNIVLKVEKDPSALIQGGPGPITFADHSSGADRQAWFSPRFPGQFRIGISHVGEFSRLDRDPGQPEGAGTYTWFSRQKPEPFFSRHLPMGGP